MLVGPLATHEFTMPTKQRLRSHEERTPCDTRQHPAGGGQEQPIGAAKLRLANVSAKNLELVAKHEDLKVLLLVVATADQPAEESADHEIDQRPKHARMLRIAQVTSPISNKCTRHAYPHAAFRPLCSLCAGYPQRRSRSVCLRVSRPGFPGWRARTHRSQETATRSC